MSRPKLTPEQIHDAIVANSGSRKDAAKSLGVSTDVLLIRMRQYRDKGYTFPEAENECSRAAKFFGQVKVGEWAEYGPEQQRCEVLSVKQTMACVRYESGQVEWVGKKQLAWVPSGDVIADETRKIRETWAPHEFRRRAPWAFSGDFDIPEIDRQSILAAEW